MGIYIKGMEMPRNCYICDDMFLLSTIRCECSEFGLNERPPDCPLTKVSEPHGRLIDADKLLGECRPRGIADDVWKASNEYKQIVNAPTIIESEVEE